MIKWPGKDPAELLDYSWTIPLDPADSVAGTPDISVQAGTIGLANVSQEGGVATFWISGGGSNELARVDLRAATTDGRIFRDVGILPVFERASAILADFRMRYDEFASVEDGQIGFWLVRAGAIVGANWPADAIDEAKEAWAAHQLAQAGALSGGAMPEGVTSFRSGDFSATFGEATAGRTGYDATRYGRDFKALQRRHFGGGTSAWKAPAAPGLAYYNFRQ